MVFAFCWTRVWIVTRFELQRFEGFLDQLRQFEKFMPVPLEQVLTYAGSLALTFDEPVLILCMLVWSISRGSDVVSGELGRGTLEMLLSQPIGRLKLMVAHLLLAGVGVIWLTALAWLGLYMGIQTNSVRETVQSGLSLQIPFSSFKLPIFTGTEEVVMVPLNQRVDARLFIAPCFNLMAFSMFILGLSALLSAVDRYRWRTIGCVLGFYVLELLLYLLAKATPATAWCQWFTFFTLYQPDGIVHLISRDPQSAWSLWTTPTTFWTTSLGPLGISLVLLLMATACFIIAGWWFQRRDLPAPV
ncbi:MAG: ABC transporter permease subunit [Pirellulaceae bacterium]|nr:ABC transporter permease subunit [Pirellulaceae bacterium]